jgi:hypothetical protein
MRPVCLTLFFWAIGGAACDGTPEQAPDAGVNEPKYIGEIDKRDAIAIVNQARQFDATLALEDPDPVLDDIDWLIGNATLVVNRKQAPSTSALEAASSGAPAVFDHGSASCDRSGCTFAHYLHIGAGAYSETAEGTVTRDDGGPDLRTITVDLVIQDDDSSPGRPFHVNATWTSGPSRLDGDLHVVTERVQDDDIHFDAIMFSDDEPTGGSLHGKSTDHLGTFEATAYFP